jgi:hypothetical protein
MFIESQIANVGRATNGSPVHKECGFALPDIINLNINPLRETLLFCTMDVQLRIEIRITP